MHLIQFSDPVQKKYEDIFTATRHVQQHVNTPKMHFNQGFALDPTEKIYSSPLRGDSQVGFEGAALWQRERK